MKTYFPTADEAKRMIAKQELELAILRSRLASEERIMNELQKVLGQVQEREANGLPTGVFVNEPDDALELAKKAQQ
jgi:hypothetical protein